MSVLWVLLPHGLDRCEDGPGVSFIDLFEICAFLVLTKDAYCPAVVACGGYQADGVREADAVASLLSTGHPHFRVYLETRSLNTIDQARNVLEIARENGFSEVRLLCWDKHERRAAWTFKRVFRGSGIEVRSIPVPAPYSATNYQRRLRGPVSWHAWNFLGWLATAKEFLLAPRQGNPA